MIEQIPIINYCSWSAKKEKEKFDYYDNYISPKCKIISIRGRYGYDTTYYRWIDSMWYAHYKGVYSQCGYSGILIYPEDYDYLINPLCINSFPTVPADPIDFPYE